MSTQAPELRHLSETVADLVDRLGGIALERLRLHPPLGTATEDDLIRVNEAKQGLCELVEGVLVEKAVGYYESALTMLLAGYLGEYLNQTGTGYIVGPDGMIRFAPGLVRLPDISLLLWADHDEHRVPRVAIGAVIPALAIEVLSAGNTKREIERKLHEYFTAGVRLVWIVDPPTRTVRVHTSETDVQTLSENERLLGGDVLPGFELSIQEWFTRLD